MKRWERWGLHSGTALVGLTGVLYGYFRYFGQVEGEFGPEPHPWQALVQHSHVLAAPLLVFALGMAVRGHASGMLKHHVTRGRRTGISMLAVITPMVVGGYAIQVVTSPALRVFLAWVHGIGSLLFVAVYLVHWRKPSASRQSAQPSTAASRVRLT